MEELDDSSSTFSGRLDDDILGFVAIDNFTERNYDASAFFLSHVHKPQLKGIYEKEERDMFENMLSENRGKVFYCSEITKMLFLNFYGVSPAFNELIVELRTGVPEKVGESKDGFPVTVTLIESNHIVGAVMFLFECMEKKFRALYTGHFRLEARELIELHNDDGTIKKIKNLYLDTTFATSNYPTFPNRVDATRTITRYTRDWLAQSPTSLVAITAGMKFGYEHLLRELSEAFGMGIVVPVYLHTYYYSNLEMLNNGAVVSFIRDGSQEEWLSYLRGGNGKIHYCYDQITCELCEAVENSSSFQLLKIRPCAKPFTVGNGQRQPIGVIEGNRWVKVNYSMHCSLEELDNFVKYLNPERTYPIDVFNDETTNSIIPQWNR